MRKKTDGPGSRSHGHGKWRISLCGRMKRNWNIQSTLRIRIPRWQNLLLVRLADRMAIGYNNFWTCWEWWGFGVRKSPGKDHCSPGACLCGLFGCFNFLFNRYFFILTGKIAFQFCLFNVISSWFFICKGLLAVRQSCCGIVNNNA